MDPCGYRFEVDRDGVALLAFSRPERLNAVTWELAAALVGLLRNVRERDGVKAVVLTGAGRAFCSGAETGCPPGRQRTSPGGPIAELTRAIVAVDKPVIAALHGPVMGAGLSYALACDRRFADPTARLCVATARLGDAPGSGVTYFLPRLTRLSTALMMVETGRVLDAAQAHREGLVDEVVAEGGDVEAALAYARTLARGPSVAIDLGRRCVHRGQHSSLTQSYDDEAVVCTLAARTRDAREGTRALLERRRPRFEGR